MISTFLMTSTLGNSDVTCSLPAKNKPLTSSYLNEMHEITDVKLNYDIIRS